MDPKSWYRKGLRFECTGCGNCCKNHGAYTFVYLSERDLDAIPAHLGITRRAFMRRFCQKSDGWTVLRMDQPACPFLDAENRCRIYPVRPKQCATWPFWPENLERSTWEGPLRADCPGIGEGPLVPAREIERRARESE
jgi:Fe-S-cluster containining protein